MKAVLLVALIGMALLATVQAYGYPGYRNYYSDDDDAQRQLAYQRMMRAQRQHGHRSYYNDDDEENARQQTEDIEEARQIQQRDQIANQLLQQPVEAAKQEAAAQAAANQAMAQQLMAQQNFAAQQAAARQAAQNVQQAAQQAAQQGSAAQQLAPAQRQVRAAVVQITQPEAEQQHAQGVANDRRVSERQQAYHNLKDQAAQSHQVQKVSAEQSMLNAQQVAHQQALIAAHQEASKHAHLNRRRQTFNGQKMKLGRQTGLVGANGMHLSNGNYVSYAGQRGIADNEFVFGLKPYIRTDAPVYAVISNSSTTPSTTTFTAAPVGK